MKKLAIFSLILIILSIGLVYLAGSRRDNALVVTIYPLADMMSNLVPDKEITTIVSSSTEPHDFEPTPEDLKRIYNSDLFVYIGDNLEPWVKDFQNTVEGRVNGIEFASYFDPLPMKEDGYSEVELEAFYENTDPHYWLDPIKAKEMVTFMSQELKTLYPEQYDDIDLNEYNYLQELSSLDQEYSAGLLNCSQDKIIVSHNAFGQLASRYDFEIVSINGLSAESEPSSSVLAEIVEIVNQENIKYVFVETAVSPDFAETIANETGVEILVLNPLESLSDEEVEQGEDYLSIMRSNLDNLKIAMECL